MTTLLNNFIQLAEVNLFWRSILKSNMNDRKYFLPLTAIQIFVTVITAKTDRQIMLKRRRPPTGNRYFQSRLQWSRDLNCKFVLLNSFLSSNNDRSHHTRTHTHTPLLHLEGSGNVIHYHTLLITWSLNMRLCESHSENHSDGNLCELLTLSGV